jgi:hypothetical protein
MAEPWIIKKGDTWPNWEGQLTDANGIVDLTNATSAKLMRVPTGGGSLQTLTLTFNTPRTLGFVTRDWQTGDNDTIGTFKCEVEVTWNDGSIETFPNTGVYTMVVEPDLG